METEFFVDGIIDVPYWSLVIVQDRNGEDTLHTWSLGDAVVLGAIADVVYCDADAVELTPLLTQLERQKIPNSVHQIGYPLLSVMVARLVAEVFNSWHFIYEALANGFGLDWLRMKAFR